jgi:nucleotide-binding universal stress UspA family protein
VTQDERPAGPARRLVVDEREPHLDPDVTLVVGFAHDDVSRTALTVAANLAGRLAARLVVVHVVDLDDYPIDPEAADWEEQAQRTLREERRTVQQALVGHRFGWSYEAHSGHPVEALIAVAEAQDALLIVVGHHGSSISDGLRRLLEGSVSRRLVRVAARPVLVVPHA